MGSCSVSMATESYPEVIEKCIRKRVKVPENVPNAFYIDYENSAFEFLISFYVVK